MFKFIDDRLEDLFWISYILFIVSAPIAAIVIFAISLYTTFIA